MRIIRLKEVIDSTGLARSTIYKYIGRAPSRSPSRWGTAASAGSTARCMIGSWQGLRSGTWPRVLQYVPPAT